MVAIEIEKSRAEPKESCSCAGGNGGCAQRFFAGYLKNDEATEEAWRGGWFTRAMWVRQRPDECSYSSTARRNIIALGGEYRRGGGGACLQAHDAVSQVAVLAVSDECARKR